MIKKITCIVCPNGCEIEIDGDNIRGYTCKRGLEYAKNELLAPKRTITSTVRISGVDEVCPVKTSLPIPKEEIFNVMKEILYKLILKENIYKYYDKLLNLLYLCGKYKSSNIYLIAVIHFLIYVFDKEGIDYLSYLKENSLDTTTIDSFLDFKDLSNIILNRETLKNILKNLNLFIASNLNTKLNSIELL